MTSTSSSCARLGSLPPTPWAGQVQELAADIAAWTGNDARVLDIGLDEIPQMYEPVGVLDDVLRDGVPLGGSEAALRRAVRQVPSRA